MSILGAGLKAALAAVLAVVVLWALGRFAGTWVAVLAGTIGGLAFLIGLTFAGLSRLVRSGGRLLDGLRDWLSAGPAALPGATDTDAAEATVAEAAGVAPYPSAAAMRRR